MGCDIQINPTAPVRGVSMEVFELLLDHTQDYAIRYCYVPEGDVAPLLARLRALTPRNDEEAAAVRELTQRLAEDGGVELFLSA